jgi:tripartite-type tricarboxylate transporter receptor subunit TctC
MKTRQLLQAVCAVACAIFGAVPPALAQDNVATYPQKPIRVMVGFPAGGSTDSPMRALAEDAGKILKQPVIIENRPGAAGLMPAQLLQSSPADGYTVGVIPSNLFRLPYTGKVGWDPATDLEYVIGLTEFVYGLVVPADSPLKNMDDFLAYAKAHPGELSYATAGAYLTQHITMEQMARVRNVKLNHVPYKGTNEALNAVMGGHVMAASETTAWGQFVEAGKLRLLATFGDKRMAQFPQAPTLKEAGIDIQSPSSAWGLAVPRNTPASIVRKIHDAFRQAMEMPGFTNALAQYYMKPQYMGTAQYQRFAADQLKLQKTLLDQIGFVREN